MIVGQATTQLQSSGSDSPELIKVRDRHYKPSMDNDIIEGAQSIIRGKIMDLSTPAMQTIVLIYSL